MIGRDSVIRAMEWVRLLSRERLQEGVRRDTHMQATGAAREGQGNPGHVGSFKLREQGASGWSCQPHWRPWQFLPRRPQDGPRIL